MRTCEKRFWAKTINIRTKDIRAQDIHVVRSGSNKHPSSVIDKETGDTKLWYDSLSFLRNKKSYYRAKSDVKQVSSSVDKQ